ncbi:TonB family protein [Thermodesulfatator indicus DSM 15286]|uniref:TonB family protein n=1 Tax=Thermodesulfatator indicus (strain DSM 15286 / JCM 11887 / CIR29812) TaxID=667014 RepID=F8ACR6_THEID|nr:TonB family protein [Thermodesulfatator indicus]AEH45847.1 TonB family protein [Thermodesulfatator indicus DSM 15286]
MAFNVRESNLAMFLLVSLVIHGLLFWLATRLKLENTITPATEIPIELVAEEEESPPPPAPNLPQLTEPSEVNPLKITPEKIDISAEKPIKIAQVNPIWQEINIPERQDLPKISSPEVPVLPEATSLKPKRAKKQFKEYFAKVRRLIAANKYYPLSARMAGYTGRIGVSFVVDAQGRVSEITIEKPSQYEILNQAAVKTIKRAAPFPPPPRGLNPPLRLKVTIKYQLD